MLLTYWKPRESDGILANRRVVFRRALPNNLSEKSIPPKIFRLVDFPHCPVRDLFHVQLVFAWAVLQTQSGLSGVAPRYT